MEADDKICCDAGLGRSPEENQDINDLHDWNNDCDLDG